PSAGGPNPGAIPNMQLRVYYQRLVQSPTPRRDCFNRSANALTGNSLRCGELTPKPTSLLAVKLGTRHRRIWQGSHLPAASLAFRPARAYPAAYGKAAVPLGSQT